MDHARRLDAQVLVLDLTGTSVLLVLPADRPDWTLPGGSVIPGESVAVAARRALRDRIGLEREISHGLVEDQSRRTSTRALRTASPSCATGGG